MKSKTTSISVGDKFLYKMPAFPDDWYAIKVTEITRDKSEVHFYFKIIDASGIYTETIGATNWWNRSTFSVLKKCSDDNMWVRLENSLREQQLVQA